MRPSSLVLRALRELHLVAFMTFFHRVRPSGVVALVAAPRETGRRASWHRLLVAAIALLCTMAAAQEPERSIPSLAEIEAAGATIGEVRIVVNDVFDTEDPKESNAFYRAANALHIDTRPGVIQRRLLFKPGDKFSVRVMEEAERVLRRAPYLYDVRIRPIAYHDGVVDIEVFTRDSWTLYPSVSVSRSGGQNKSEFSIEERNLLGTGASFSYGFASDVDRNSRTLQYGNDNLFGNWIALGLSVGRNSDGSKDGFSLVRPFYELDARWAAGVLAVDDDRIDSVYNEGELAAEYRHRQRLAEVFGGWSPGLVGGWVDRYSVGVRLSEDTYAFEPGRAAPTYLPSDEKLLGPFVRYELIEDNYQKTFNRNQMGRPEFFDVGLHATVQLGWAAAGLGSTYDALLYSASISRGFGPLPEHTLMASAAIKGQYTGGEIRRQQTSASAQYYMPHHRRWLFYASVSGDVLTNPDPSDFLYLGGDNGLRGYPLRYQSGTQRALLTLEERLYTEYFPFRLFRVGAAVFADVGRAWGGTNQNATDSGWLADVGFGMRFFSVRSAAGNVIHVDLAFPVNAQGDVQSVQFLVSGKASF